MPTHTTSTSTPIINIEPTKHAMTGTPGTLTVTVNFKASANHLVSLIWGFMQTTQNQNFKASSSNNNTKLEYCNCTLIEYKYPYLLSDTIAPIMQIDGVSMRQVDNSLTFAIHGYDVLTITPDKRATNFNAGHVIDALCVSNEAAVKRAAMLNELSTVLVMSHGHLSVKRAFIELCINKTSSLYEGIDDFVSWENDNDIKEAITATRRNLVAATHAGDDELASRYANVLRWAASSRRLCLTQDYKMLYWGQDGGTIIETFTKDDLRAINII